MRYLSLTQALKSKNNQSHIENVSYQQAIGQLHDQLYNLNLEDYASKIKVKKRVY